MRKLNLAIIALQLLFVAVSSKAASLNDGEPLSAKKIGPAAYVLNFAHADEVEAIKLEDLGEDVISGSRQSAAVKLALRSIFGNIEKLSIDKTSGFMSSSVNYSLQLEATIDGQATDVLCEAIFESGSLAIGKCRAGASTLSFVNINKDHKHFGEGKDFAVFIGFSQKKIDQYLPRR